MFQAEGTETDLWRRTGIMFQWHYIESILVLQIISSKGMCNQTSTECNTCIMIERASTEELRKRKTALRWNIGTLALQRKSCWDCVVREACAIINMKPVSTVRFILDFFSCLFFLLSVFLFFPFWTAWENEIYVNLSQTWQIPRHLGGTLLVKNSDVNLINFRTFHYPTCTFYFRFWTNVAETFRTRIKSET